MAFQAKKWGWKGMAARLLLVPVLAGTSAAAGRAQAPAAFGSGGSVGAAVAAADRARALVAQAKQALDAGDLATAEALAKQAADLRATLSYSETRPDTVLAEIAKRRQKGAAGATAATAVSTSPAPAGARPADPKELLKLGQQALAAGQLDQAQDYAAQADRAATAKGYRWGLFDDTPTGLMKDVQEARAKADRVQSAELFRRAKALAGQRAATPEERQKNLEQALAMAYQAKNLHGPYSLWEFGDKPEKLIADIEAAKAQMRRKPAGDAVAAAPAAKAAGTAVRPLAGTSRPTTQTAAALPAPSIDPLTPVPAAPPAAPTTVTTDLPSVAAIANPVKDQVAKLVADGRALLAQDKVLEARAKADAARKLAAAGGLPAGSFGPTEDTPDQLFQAAQAKGHQMVQSLTRQADELAAQNTDAAKAALDAADGLSAGLGLYSKPIADRRAKLAAMATGAAPAVAAAPVAAVPVKPLMAVAPPSAPVLPPGGITVVGTPGGDAGMAVVRGADVPKPAAATTNAVGEQVVSADAVPAAAKGRLMLSQAEMEMRRGDFDMAKKLAVTAFNADASAKADAQALLRSIDAEQTAVKRKEAETALRNGMTAYANKEYEQALGVLKLIDPAYLAADQKAKAAEVMTDCLAKTDKAEPAKGSAVALAAGTEDDKPAMKPSKPAVSGVAEEQRAMANIAFQKLRQDGFAAMNDAAAAWNRGETDAAIRLLEEHAAKVKASGQPAGIQNSLLTPINTRLDGYGRLKHNIDVLKNEADAKSAVRRDMITKNVAEAQAQEEIKRKMAEVAALNKAEKHKEAAALAAQLKQLDPDNPTLQLVYQQSVMLQRKKESADLRAGQEEMFRIGLNEAENEGPVLTNDRPLKIDQESYLRSRGRNAELYSRPRTPTEFRIEQQLSTPFSLSFDGMPLREALRKIRTETKLNIVTEDAALEDERISLDGVTVTEDLKDLPLRDALTILLAKARLSFMVENNVVKITTEKRSKGRLTTKVFHVMDLVTPIPEYKLSPHHTFAAAMAQSRSTPPVLSAPTPTMGGALGGAQLTSSGTGATPQVGQAGGSLQSAMTGPESMTGQRVQYAQQLKKLVTGMVRAQSWGDLGGPGSIEYFDIGGALVVNQTADVISEVAQLLDALRRLQDLSVSVEIRVVSLSEAFFERVGVDFDLNIKTNNTNFERQVATSTFRPEPFLNKIDVSGTTVGWSPATSFTSDLNVPVRSSSYDLTAPPFGGYQTSLSPTLNGGLSLGLAFLNDIQVYMFLEAAQGNRRVNIMQAPKLTLFNGQTSTVFVGDFAFFATGVQAFNVGGQFVYTPQVQAFPIGQGFNPNTASGGQQPGVSLTVQAVISADRRFVRLNLTPSLTALTSANVPLFPVTTFVTPVFEGGSQGQPIPFTQFFQLPTITEISAQTTVAVPDGGTVLLGGLKTMSQGRNEFGPPVLSQVPYLNRLFKNVGIGQETRHVMLMVTPRIIISSEEELRQTGETGGGLAPQP
jgi:type II secretory pathway component GspD/PulD (secretin)